MRPCVSVNLMTSGFCIIARSRAAPRKDKMAKLSRKNRLRTFAIWRCIERNRRRRIVLFSVMSLLTMRKKILLNLLLSLLGLVQSCASVAKPRHRSCRRFYRNPGWWQVVWNSYSDSRFKKTLRISRGTFQHILNHIRHLLTRENINEASISPEERLAICLYRLGRGDYYHTISQMLGLGIATICIIVSEVSHGLVSCLWANKVTKHLPTTEEMFINKMVDMEELWQFPYCWAAVDGCHIPIKCPPGGLESCKEYHNFKNFYSVVLMAFVDAKYRFIWASCGFPGNSHDAVVLQSTDLWQQMKEGDFIPKIGKEVHGKTVPPLILGDSAFPFQTWLIKPYTNAVLTPKQLYFNYRLSRARMVTEGAYGQLKGRWRVLLWKCEIIIIIISFYLNTIRITAKLMWSCIYMLLNLIYPN